MVDRFTTGRAAKALGVSDSTVRKWAVVFAAHLSAGANPGHGEQRVFTRADLGVLSMVRDWRAADPLLGDKEIADRLRQVPPAELRAGPAVEHAAGAAASSAAGSPVVSGAADEQPKIGGDPGLALPVPAGDPSAVLVAAVVDRLGAVDQRLAALERDQHAQRLIAPWVVAGLVLGGLLGFLIGLVVMGAR